MNAEDLAGNPAIKKLQLADGTLLTIERGLAGVHRLTLGHSPVTITTYVTGDDLRRLCNEPGAERCANCRFSRCKPSGGDWRCHRNTPRKRGDETFFPRVSPDDWCGKYRAHEPARAAAVAA